MGVSASVESQRSNRRRFRIREVSPGRQERISLAFKIYESSSAQERGSGRLSTQQNTPNIFPFGPCTGRRNILTNTSERRPQPHRAKPADPAPSRAPHGKPARPAGHARPGLPGKSQPRAPRGRIPCRDRPPSGPPHHPRRPLRRRRTHPHPIRPAGARSASRHHAAPSSPRPAITCVVARPFPLVPRAQSPRTPHRSHQPGACRPAHRRARAAAPVIARAPAVPPTSSPRPIPTAAPAASPSLRPCVSDRITRSRPRSAKIGNGNSAFSCAECYGNETNTIMRQFSPAPQSPASSLPRLRRSHKHGMTFQFRFSLNHCAKERVAGLDSHVW